MSLEELKKSFIVDEESFEESKIEEFLSKILKICQIDKQGHVRFIDEKLGDKEKVKYILVARFLANKLDPSISKEIENEEFEKILGKSKEQVRARLSDVRNEKPSIMKDLNRNTHEIKPLFVQRILKEIKND